MHEYSIVQALIGQCEDLADENNASKVIKVVIKIGILSGVEPHLLESAFDTFKEETICAQAELVVNKQKLKLHCNNCDDEFEVDGHEYLCQSCQSNSVRIVDGEDMYLMSLEME
ncbi:MAG: hydrogenase/urease nickel incorporation protein HypA [Sulfurovum sp.]|nr:hydrogenase/urease nickel incorporation protein HypA [Sulfurovum sp.]